MRSFVISHMVNYIESWSHICDYCMWACTWVIYIVTRLLKIFCEMWDEDGHFEVFIFHSEEKPIIFQQFGGMLVII
jgi:hypothetical protein